jgi:Cu/Zn superoxide dismutase
MNSITSLSVFDRIISSPSFSLIRHAEGVDDLGQGTGDKRKESLKTGNAGGRMLCAIIGKSKDGKL